MCLHRGLVTFYSCRTVTLQCKACMLGETSTSDSETPEPKVARSQKRARGSLHTATQDQREKAVVRTESYIQARMIESKLLDMLFAGPASFTYIIHEHIVALQIRSYVIW